MKALKIVLGIVVALVIIVAVLVGIALIPAVQTWAVRKAVANQPGLQVGIGRVAAGFSGADLTNVHIVRNGMVINATHAVARYSAWDYLAHRQINVDDLTVQGLVVDTRGAKPAATAPATTTAQPSRPPAARSGGSPAAPRPQFNGLLTDARLPYDVRIAHFSVPGRLLLANDQTVVFELNGSDIATGRQGTVDWKVDVTNTQPGVALRGIHSTGTATVHITTERRIDLADINATTRVEGPRLPPDRVQLVARAEQPAPGGNEGYNLAASLIHNGRAQPLFTAAAHYSAADHQIAGAWTLSLRSDELKTLLAGLGWPEITANGSGQFTVNPDAGGATATGKLESDLSHLDQLEAGLGQIGSIHLQTNFDAGLANQVARISRFTLDATADNGRQLAQIETLQPVGFSLADRRVSLANANTDLARVSIQQLPLAWAQPFAKGLKIVSGDLSMSLAVAAQPDGSHVRITSVQPLTIRNLTVRNATRTLADRLNLSVKPQADYSPARTTAELDDLNASMPSGDTVRGRFTADITHPGGVQTIAFTTDTDAKFVALLKPYLNADTGPLTVSTKSAGTLAGNELHFAHSNTRITRPSGQLISAIDLEQPLTLDLKSNAISTPKPGAEALRIALGQIPLAWAQGFVANSTFGGQVSGGTVGITLRSLEDVSANTTQPIAIGGITVAMNGQPMLQNVDLTANFSAHRQGGTVHYDVRQVDAKQGAATLLSLTAAGQATLGAKPAISAKGTLQADLGALARQPVAASSASLERGTLNGTFEADITNTIQANARLTARDLVAKQGNQPLGTAELDLTAAVQPDGSSRLKVPFTLTNGSRKSDLLIDGTLARTGNAIDFDGRVTSNLLVIDDLKPLAALAPSSKPVAGTPASRPAIPAMSPTGAPPPAPGTPPSSGAVAATPGAPGAGAAGARDTQPFWNGFGGRIALDLKRITYGQHYTISNVQGDASATPGQLAVRSLQGQFKDNPFKLAATIDFDARQPQPYSLAATADVSNFDVGAILQAANPSEPPQLETKVTVHAKVDSHGTNLTKLAEDAYGTFDVTGSKGVLRALGQKSGRAVSVLSGLGGIFGAVKGSDTAVALSQLTQKLAELPFDKFSMHVERGADLNLKVGRIEFLSPDTHITGSGGIQNEPGVPIQNQPMKFTLQLGGKGDMAVLLNRVKMLNGKKDPQGYYTMDRTFTVGGTPAKPDSSDLWKLLAQVGTSAALPGLLKMFGH